MTHTGAPVAEVQQPKLKERYDVAILGAGPGGYVAAISAAQLGLATVVIEKGEIGGTCLNRGCIPTKTLLHTAELYEETQQAALFGLTVDKVALDFAALRARKVEVCATLREGVENLLAANGVDVVAGTATVLSPTQIKVEGASQSGEPLLITADNSIIATGTTPELPAISGIDLPGVYTSDSILEEIPAPKRLVVVGGGVIGMEFASIYASYGTEVTVLITSDRPLRSLDREIGQSLSMEMKKKGAQIVTRAVVTRIEEAGEDRQKGTVPICLEEQGQIGTVPFCLSLSDTPLRVAYTVKDEEQTIEADAVLIAKGRVSDIPAVLGGNLELANERGRILVDEKMQTSVAGVYAIGDICNAGPELAHAASAEGIVATHAIAGKPCTKRLDLVPTCVYTSPEIAAVGLSEAEAKEAGLAVTVGKYPMAGNSKTLITAQGRSFIKIVATEDERVVGAQLMCARATDIIGELALGIAAGLTVTEMLQIARPHPTFEEAVGEALEQVTGTSIHSMPKRR